MGLRLVRSIADQIAALERLQEGRRAHIKDVEGLITYKQREIDNLRAQLEC